MISQISLGKIGPRGKKSIFGYSDTSKGYVFIAEQDSGSVTEIESRDVTFVENEFPKKGEIDLDRSLYEIQDQVEQTPVNSSGRVETADDESVRRLPDSSPAEANGTDSAPDDLVDSGSIRDLILSGSDHGHTLVVVSC